MKAEYNLSTMKSRKNPYASKLRAPLSMHKWRIMGIKLPELRFKMLPIYLILLASCALL